jgi:hypothetical protein
MEDCLKQNSDSEPNSDAEQADTDDSNVKLGVPIADYVVGVDDRDVLVHEEVLLSWGELLDMSNFCFRDVVSVQQKTTWEIYQHATQEAEGGTQYHYWGTDTRLKNSSRAGSRRRRDMIRVRGEHLCEIVCFVKARFPSVTRLR